MNLTASKILVPAILALSVSAGAADLNFQGRGDFNVSLDISKMPLGSLDFKSYGDIINHLLSKNGVIADETSKVWVRQEETKVELNCFDCLLINSNNDIYVREPINKATRGDGF